jgi:hypothetical protein
MSPARRAAGSRSRCTKAARRAGSLSCAGSFCISVTRTGEGTLTARSEPGTHVAPPGQLGGTQLPCQPAKRRAPTSRQPPAASCRRDPVLHGKYTQTAVVDTGHRLSPYHNSRGIPTLL